MKTVKQQFSLSGKEESISLSELRAKPGEVFAQVEMGKKFNITKNGRIIGQIIPPESFDWGALDALRRASK